MPAHPGARRTARLRLEPVGPEHAEDLWRLHQDEAVAAWHGRQWTLQDAHRFAAAMAQAWAADGVGKWIAHDRRTGELVGRGGLSRLPATAPVTGQVAVLLAGEAWLADRLELGWTVRSELGVRGTPARSAGPGWPWRSTTWALRGWWPSPSGTTAALGR